MSDVADRNSGDNPFSDGPVIGAEVAAEMAKAFGWDVPPTDEELEAQYAARRCDEEELLARFPGLYDKPDGELIALVAEPLPVFSDRDEVAAAAAIILQRRLDGVTRRRPT